MKTLLLSCFLAAAVFQSNPVADKVVAYAKQNFGKKIDRGECWDLANAALNRAGAAWESPFGFGTKVDYKKEALRPGDILQFTNVKFETEFSSAFFPQHTAIVYKANKDLVTVFHQNFNNKRTVDSLTLNLADIKDGKLEAFRPKAK